MSKPNGLKMARMTATKEDADRHQMLVASHTGLPIGRPKWLEKECRKRRTLPLGKGHIKFIAYLRQAFPHTQHSFPAISPYLWARLYGWLLTSNAYGISLTQNH